MAEFYGKRIMKGLMTIEQVPARFKDATEAWLKEHGESND